MRLTAKDASANKIGSVEINGAGSQRRAKANFGTPKTKSVTKFGWHLDEMLTGSAVPDYSTLEILSWHRHARGKYAIATNGEKFFAVSGGNVRFCIEAETRSMCHSMVQYLPGLKREIRQLTGRGST